MTDRPDFWARIKQARVSRVVAVYLGAPWVILQVSSTVVDAFKLPDWVLPSAIILMLINQTPDRTLPTDSPGFKRS